MLEWEKKYARLLAEENEMRFDAEEARRARGDPSQAAGQTPPPPPTSGPGFPSDPAGDGPTFDFQALADAEARVPLPDNPNQPNTQSFMKQWGLLVE